MAAFKSILLLVGAIVTIGLARKPLPSYISPCKLNDAEKCYLDTTKALLPHILEGDKEYNIPSFKPLKIKSADVSPGPNLNLKLNNIEIDNLSSATVDNIIHDPKAGQLKFQVHTKDVKFKSKYEMKGKILVLPIEGNGDLDIALDGLDLFSTLIYTVSTKDDGIKYLTVDADKSTLDYKTKKITFHLTNLFNGDKRLGDEMNKFLNDNWEAASKEFVPAVIDVIHVILLNTLNGIAAEVPYDEIFLL